MIVYYWEKFKFNRQILKIEFQTIMGESRMFLQLCTFFSRRLHSSYCKLIMMYKSLLQCTKFNNLNNNIR